MNQMAHFQRILLIGQDNGIITWFRNQAKKAKMPWNIQVVEPLRVGAPEVNLSEPHVIVLIWTPHQLNSLNEIFAPKNPAYRSPEGTLLTLQDIGKAEIVKKIVAIGYNFTREETVLLAESNVKLVLTFPEKRSKWDTEGLQILFRIQKLILEKDSESSIREEKATEEFQSFLGVWEKMSDEKKMESTENLLAVLGDSARYAELMARKSLKEGDGLSAEKWLLRAIHKNPNYMQAMQLLADVYYGQKRYDESMALLKKMQLSSPRNILRLSKMGDCLLSNGDFQKAEQILTDALLLDEYNMEVRESLGKVKCVMEDYTAARLLLANTRNQKALAVFLNKLAVDFVEKKQYDKAIKHYKNALYVLPGNEQNHLIFFNIALAYFKCELLNEALKYASLAVARAPQYDRAKGLLAIIEKRLTP